MATVNWSQDKFSQGELSPLMYARITVNSYYDCLKTAKNVFTLPQGAATKRFGTRFLDQVITESDYKNIFFKSWQYLDECTYILVIRPQAIDIYLEGTLQLSIFTTLVASDIQSFDYTILNNRFRITSQFQKPFDIVRDDASSIPIEITTFTATTLGFAAPAIGVDSIVPIEFVSGTLPTTSPQVRTIETYFARGVTTTSFSLHSTSKEAYDNVNAFDIIDAGVAAMFKFLTAFTLTDVVFDNTPVFDFGEINYDAITFTPNATNATTITASANIFVAANVGGSFTGNGGVSRILSVNSPLSVNVSTLSEYFDGSAISGDLAVLTEPAWSDTRGWPQKCSSYQSRSIFANTELLPNGVWLSVINDYNDFNDLETDDDDAISWYPTSDNVNVVNFLVPYRSLTVHTNTGVYSTPLSQDTAVTPSNFSLTIQDSTPATRVQPRTIDNQIIVLSGADSHALIFDGINNAYTTAMISVINEQVLTNPIDQTEYRDLQEAGSRYMFVINEDGTLAIYQTLITESISGWTRSVLEQSYGEAKFRALTSNSDGRLWFMNERQLAEASAAIAVTAFTTDTLTAIGSNFDAQPVTAFKFTAVPVTLITTPEVTTGVYYWAVGIDADTFMLYTTQEDALADTNRILIDASTVVAGTLVQPWPLVTRLEIEELASNGVVDGATVYEGAPTSTITGASRFNAQDIKINGDGFGFEAQGIDDEIQITAHGEPVEVSVAEYGFPIDLIIEPLPLSIALGNNVQSTNLAEPKHIRNAHFLFNDTVGGTVNGVPIAVNTFAQTSFGAPPNPMNGFFEFSVMKGWNDFDNPTFTIEHNEPFNIRLLGIFYVLEV